MKGKSLISTMLIGLMCSASLWAQDQSVTGKVTDENGEGLPGASVVVKGTSIGTTTNLDGSYKLSVSEGGTISISYVGYVTQDIPVGGRSVIDVQMALDATQMEELVVTALGIEREASTLTYAQQSVDGGEITKARDVNFLNSLSGRAAGVEIKKSSGGPGGSTRVILRGDKNLQGDSQPLFVIDGIPMANNRGEQPEMWGGVDAGDGISQLNPDDIESISVLKGANAAALYGSQGANGVVLITTKKGKSGAAKVNFSSGITFESVLLKPDLQYEYGALNNIKESWDTNPGEYDDNYVDEFFRIGANVINSVAVSGGNDKTTAYFSYANVSATSIMPNNSYTRNNVTFKQSTKLLQDKLKVSSSVMLAHEKSKNRPAAGYYLNALTGLYMFPRERDYRVYKDTPAVLNEDRNVYEMNWYVDNHHQSNPWYIMTAQPSVIETKRVISSLNLDYDITDKLVLSVRGSVDYSDKLVETRYASGGNTTNIHSNGRWDYRKVNDELYYTDAILKYNDKFGDFSLSAIAGTSYQKTTYGKGLQVNTGLDGLLYPNEFFFQNLPPVVPVESVLGRRVIKQGVFLNTTLGYRDMLYVDFSGRTDWASTLIGTGNENYFYPAVGVSGVLSEMLSMPEPITFAKFRLSVNRVGNEVPYNIIIPTNKVDGKSGGVELGTVAPGKDLKPEIITTREFGTNWRFLDDRIGIDLTYYNITSKDQYLKVDALAGSKYSKRVINIGEINNKGVEIIVDGTPIYTSNFKWKTVLNFSRNVNTVVSADPDNEENFVETGKSEGYLSRFRAGGSIGDIYTLSFKRDDQGRIRLEKNDKGKIVPLKTEAGEHDLNYRGNLNPDWSLGWTNAFSYKNFSLDFIINGKFGGKAVSKTEAMLDEAGVSQRTADDRERGFTPIDGVLDGNAVSEINPEDYYRAVGGRNGIMEPYVYSRTNVRLTQMSLSYNTKLTALNLPVSFSVVGQNLFFLYIDAPFDPELAMSTNRKFQSLDNFNLPASRTIGFNLNVSF